MTFWCGVELCDGFILERVAVITCRHLGRNVCSRGSKCTRFLLHFFLTGIREMWSAENLLLRERQMCLRSKTRETKTTKTADAKDWNLSVKYAVVC